MRLTSAGYGELAAACLETAQGAARGRAVFVVEGGYDTEGLATGAAAVVGRMLGDDKPMVTAPCARSFADLVASQRRFLATWWPIG
jgi:acetoin utilization deacetylase AcuC-like enzyme